MNHRNNQDRNELAKRAALLHLSSLSLANGMKSGSFKSLYHGQGVEFSGVRDYLIGDDIRTIDWNVTARMGKPYVKMFEEEHELNVFIVADRSLSMNTGAEKRSRLETAMECCALLTLASLQNSSPVGAVLFDGEISFSTAPKGGKNHALSLLSKFEEEFNPKNGSYLDNALQGAGKLLKKRTLVLVISDFRTEGWEHPLAYLAQHHDVVAIRITDPMDEELPDTGSIPFIDVETGYQCVLPTSSVPFRKVWREDNKMRVDLWKKECIKRGAFPFCLNTQSDVAVELTRFFAGRSSI